MSDPFISLKCPYCGGNMNKDEKRNLVVCPACGSEHLLKENVGSLTPIVRKETHACPLCRQNDQVMKVSAIVSSQVQQTNGSTKISTLATDYRGKIYSSIETVPIQATQVSRLAQLLRFPDPPANPYNSEYVPFWHFIGYWFIAFMLTFLLFAIIFGSTENSRVLGLSISSLIMLGITAMLIRQYIRNNATRRKFEEFERHLKNVLYPKMGKAYKRWNEAYYCSRDDQVFIDGEKIYIDPERFTAWLIETMT